MCSTNSRSLNGAPVSVTKAGTSRGGTPAGWGGRGDSVSTPGWRDNGSGGAIFDATPCTSEATERGTSRIAFGTVTTAVPVGPKESLLSSTGAGTSVDAGLRGGACVVFGVSDGGGFDFGTGGGGIECFSIDVWLDSRGDLRSVERLRHTF